VPARCVAAAAWPRTYRQQSASGAEATDRASPGLVCRESDRLPGWARPQLLEQHQRSSDDSSCSCCRTPHHWRSSRCSTKGEGALNPASARSPSPAGALACRGCVSPSGLRSLGSAASQATGLLPEFFGHAAGRDCAAPQRALQPHQQVKGLWGPQLPARSTACTPATPCPSCTRRSKKENAQQPPRGRAMATRSCGASVKPVSV